MMVLAIDWALILEKIILISIGIVSISLLIAMYETYAERKVAAYHAGSSWAEPCRTIWILQPLADGLKLFMKEEIIPNSSNKISICTRTRSRHAHSHDDSAVIPWGVTH